MREQKEIPLRLRGLDGHADRGLRKSAGYAIIQRTAG